MRTDNLISEPFEARHVEQNMSRLRHEKQISIAVFWTKRKSPTAVLHLILEGKNVLTSWTW